jgi:hypothetical protein
LASTTTTGEQEEVEEEDYKDLWELIDKIVADVVVVDSENCDNNRSPQRHNVFVHDYSEHC